MYLSLNQLSKQLDDKLKAISSFFQSNIIMVVTSVNYELHSEELICTRL